MKRQTILCMLVALSSAIGVLTGCHASPEDAGQADELADPVRRQNAITNLNTLYTQALAAARREAGESSTVDARQDMEVRGEGGRMRPGPKAVADASIDALVRTYIQNRQD